MVIAQLSLANQRLHETQFRGGRVESKKGIVARVRLIRSYGCILSTGTAISVDDFPS
jgi:hypothetical protein